MMLKITEINYDNFKNSVKEVERKILIAISGMSQETPEITFKNLFIRQND